MILTELLEGTTTQLWGLVGPLLTLSFITTVPWHHIEKLHTPGGELGVGVKERPLLRIYLQATAQRCDG